ncbi:MAG: DEAD/DEAH box helicase [Acidimicrobiales bacterium]
MDVFEVRDQLISDYRSFTAAFVEPRDERISAFLAEQLAAGQQWPDPWLSLNPSFASGGSVTELVDAGLLHRECERIFRVKDHEDDPGRSVLTLHRHQRDAIEAASSGASYVLTTGTGSGKSLSYIVPIVDRVLRDKAEGTAQKGVKAIIVYPMNALANSQVLELEKFLRFGYGAGREPVTFARYTGQEGQDERRRILAEPPDILLTNYVMLDLVLTRPDERRHLMAAARGLKFLVLDELHTYRGRQGADVALLVRRVKDACEAHGLQVVGTSATMASGGSRAEQRVVVATVASRLFGSPVAPDHVIGETLVRATPGAEPSDRALMDAVGRAVRDRTPQSFEDLAEDPLAWWIESTFGLSDDPDTGELIRSTPTTVPAAAAALAERLDVEVDLAASAIRQTLLAGSRTRNRATGRPLFAFRLHQFVSKGDTVHVSLEPEAHRHITGQYQVRVPSQPDKALLPLGFCRECGQEYLVVACGHRGRNARLRATPRQRRLRRRRGDRLPVRVERPSVAARSVAEGRLPDHWLEEHDDGTTSVVANKRKYLPETVWVLPDGTEVGPHSDDALEAWWMSTPFALCLRCRGPTSRCVATTSPSSPPSTRKGGPLRSRCSPRASCGHCAGLAPDELDAKSRKLLTFVDNRQDASLQAGHFNDFIQVAQLRGALHSALRDGGGELTHEVVAQAVTTALRLEIPDFAKNLNAKFSQKDDAERALRRAVEYRLYTDLKRGWRVTMPNLEQVGLLEVQYADLADIAEDPETWHERHSLLAAAPAKLREELCRILLDEMRRVLAVQVECLTQEGFEQIERQADQHLREPWTIARGERLEQIGTVFPRSGSLAERGRTSTCRDVEPSAATCGAPLRSARTSPPPKHLR